MSTATVPIQITCPDWCSRPVAEHAESLWDYEGNCIHYSADRVVNDPVGYEEPLKAPVFHSPITVYMTSQSNLEGRETASPVVHLEGHELSVAQALALSEAIREVVYTYRVEGGVA